MIFLKTWEIGSKICYLIPFVSCYMSGDYITVSISVSRYCYIISLFPTVYVKRGSCPVLRGLSRNGRCVRQCRSDRDCSGSKKCCVIACSHVCIEPEAREIRRKDLK